MATRPSMSRIDDVLKKPLYVFNLPKELLVTLTLSSSCGYSQTRDSSPARPSIKDEENDPDGANNDSNATTANGGNVGPSCNLCQVSSFPTVREQREHARSDLHRYNLKLKVRGNATVTESEFNTLVEELDESISGSESGSYASGSEEDGEGDDLGETGGGGGGVIGKAENNKTDTTLTALLKKQARLAQEKDDEGSAVKEKKKKKREPGGSPLIWFKSSRLEENVSLGVYRGLFTEEEQQDEDHLVETLQDKQLAPIPHGKALDVNVVPHVFLCMIGGGHFAAMIVSLTPQLQKQGGERHSPVIAHKTFHRYTTRRKQGGSQSANDAAKGAAHSAGSSLRRYNEAALESEIRKLLTEWKVMIDTADLLFVRATGSTNRRVLFGPYDGQVLRHNDRRLRGFPFTTRRATQAELMRSLAELTRIKVSLVDEPALAAAAKAPSEESPKPPKSSPSPRSQTQKPSKEDEAAMLHTTQLQALIRRSKAPAVVSYLSSNSLSPDFEFFPPSSQQNHHASTPLHLAASTNSPAVVLALLTKVHANPTTLNGDAKTPFDLAGDRATRDAFRVSRHELGENKWDWDMANVPPALSKVEADKRSEREKREAEKAEAERRKNELERLRREEETNASNGKARVTKGGGGRTMGVAVEKTGAEKREEEGRGLSVEARTRLERERRARAAEERIRRMQGGRS